MIARPEPLTRAAFQPFGEVLETAGRESAAINQGYAQKFADLARVETPAGRQAQLSVYRSQPVSLPFLLQELECHPLASQAFFPLHSRPFPVVVAPAGEPPRPTAVRVFMTNGRQGVNLHPGVWHHWQLSLDRESDYLVIDCEGAGANLRQHRLEGELWLAA